MLIKFKFSVASTSDWPPDKKAIPGTSVGTEFFRHSSVLLETSSLEILFFELLPAKIIFGFKMIPDKSILCNINSVSNPEEAKKYSGRMIFIDRIELPKLDINNRKIFINFVKNDKKFREKKIRFILLDEIGKSRISEDITFDQIEESLGVL